MFLSVLILSFFLLNHRSFLAMGFLGKTCGALMFDYITKWLSLFIRLMNYYSSKLLQEHTQLVSLPQHLVIYEITVTQKSVGLLDLFFMYTASLTNISSTSKVVAYTT